MKIEEVLDALERSLEKLVNASNFDRERYFVETIVEPYHKKQDSIELNCLAYVVENSSSSAGAITIHNSLTIPAGQSRSFNNVLGLDFGGTLKVELASTAEFVVIKHYLRPK